MEDMIINEPVDVGVVFKKGDVSPKWFVWHDRKYEVKEVTYRWHGKCGEAPLRYFAVTTGTALFELSLNQKTLAWNLEKTTTE